MSPARPWIVDRGARTPALRLVGGAAASSAESLVEQARTAEDEGRHELALELYERALHRLDVRTQGEMATTVLLAIGRTHRAAGNASAALDTTEAALATAMAREEEGGVGRALNQRAILLWEQGELDDAERGLRDARERALRAADARLAAEVERSLGALALLRGDAEGALLHQETGLAELRSLGLPAETADALRALGDLHVDAERWDAAERSYDEAAQIAAALGDLGAVAAVETRRAEMWIARADLESARVAADRVSELAKRRRDPGLQVESTRLEGMMARELGDLARAEELLAAAERSALECQDLVRAAAVVRELAELLRRQERHRDTLQALNRAYRFQSQLRGASPMATLARHMHRLERDFLDVVTKWGQSIESKDLNTHGHCARVADLTVAIAARLGLDARTLFWYRVGALLHDVGKLVIPPDVLNKPGRLTETEWALVKRHPEAGAEMLAGVDFPWDVRPIVESHHECWDGSGYPHGLAGERIPVAARVVCIADVYDVLTSARSFKRALSHDEALEVMRRDVGRQFDPSVFHTFELVVAEHGDRFSGSGTRAGRTPLVVTTPAQARSARDDALTGVLARAPFFAAASAALQDRRGTDRPVSLLLLDVDHFRLINEAHGQQQGDDVLWAVGRVLQRGLRRGGDLVGRLGGDEFAVLLPDARTEKAQEIGERLRAAVSQLRSTLREDPDQMIAVTASIGIATAPANGESPEELMAAAERALYDARARGADSVEVAGVSSPAVRPARLQFDRFVGRAAELRQLGAWLEESARGTSRVGIIVGEAGIGKTTLLQQLEPELRLRAGVLALGRNAERAVQAPYSAWAEMLTALHERALVPARPWRELHRLVPALRQGPAPDDESSNRYVLYEEIATYLAVAAGARPLMLVLEDVHWMDLASWDALDYVVSHLTRDRILFCLTMRAGEGRDVAERRRRLARHEHVGAISLQRLTRDELKRWLETVFHQGDIGVELPAFLHEYTEGNPLLVQQVLRTLAEEGGIWYAGTRWEWRPVGELRLPSAWSQLLERRLDRLSPRARTILTAASVFDDSFDTDLLVATGVGSHDDIRGALDEGTAAGVLTTATRGADGGTGSRYVFRHALLAEAVRRSIPERQRLRLHEMAARALEVRSSTAVAEIARQYHAAGNAARAYRYARLAADRAASVHAYDEAVACLAIAQRHAPSGDELADARIRLAQVAESAGRYEQAEDMCDLALDHLATHGSPLRALPVRRMRERLRMLRGQPPHRTFDACRALLAEAEAVGEQHEIAALLIMLSQLESLRLEWDSADRFARRAVHAAEQLDDRRLHAEAALRLGTALLEIRPAEAVERLREALTLFARAHDTHGQIRCWINTGIAHTRAGYPAAAREAYDVALEIGREAHAPDLTGLASLNLGVLELKSGDLRRARYYFEEAQRLFTTVRNEPHRVAAMYNLAHLARESRTDDAERLYAATAARAREIGLDDMVVGSEAGAALVALARSPEEALAAWRRAMSAHANRLPATTWFQGRELLDALIVRDHLAAGRMSHAIDAFRQGVALAERHDAYAAAWLVAECAEPLARAGWITVSELVAQYVARAEVAGFTVLSARFAAFRAWLFGANGNAPAPDA